MLNARRPSPLPARPSRRGLLAGAGALVVAFRLDPKPARAAPGPNLAERNATDFQGTGAAWVFNSCAAVACDPSGVGLPCQRPSGGDTASFDAIVQCRAIAGAGVTANSVGWAARKPGSSFSGG